MRILKAVITAAGRGARQYPAFDSVQKSMLPLVDRDGMTKPVLQIIAEEALESGIEEICVVCAPGDEEVYRRHFDTYAANLRSAFKGVDWVEEQARRIGELAQRLRFAVQDEPQGYGHAVWCARDFVAGQPCLLLLGDHLYISHEERRCARQLIDLAEAEQCAVSAVQATRESLLPYYGVVGGRRMAGHSDLYRVDTVMEKPTPTVAEQHLLVPGLRAGHYLCCFGMHVLTPTIMEILGQQLAAAQPDALTKVTLSSALATLAGREQYLALEQQDSRYDLGVRYGLLSAQVALAMNGQDRDEVLARLLELLAQRDLAQRDLVGGR